MSLTREQIEKALANREAVMQQIVRRKCESGLIPFVKEAWKILEPGSEFVTGWAVEAIAEHLEAVTAGHIKRLLINVPPGCTKSMLTNVFWPAWEWGPKGMPFNRYISASYAQSLAIRDNVRCRDILMNDWYRDLWPEPSDFKPDMNLKTHYENRSSGFRFAASVGSALTGFRGDRIILDDPHSVKGADSDLEREETIRWFSETLPTRLNKADESAIVVIMQRVHEYDVSGTIMDPENGLIEDYVHLMLPMEFEPERKCMIQVTGFEDPREQDGELLWPERFSQDAVKSMKKALSIFGGEYASAAQLQQRPVPRGGGLFQDNWKYVHEAPEGGRVVRGWDFASSTKKRADYTASVKMKVVTNRDGLPNVYIMDATRFRKGPGEREQAIREITEADGRAVHQSMPQDPGQAGLSQKADLIRLLIGYDVHFSTESGDKETRATPLAAQVNGGNVYLVTGPWNKDFTTEVGLFPFAKFDDFVDAASRAFSRLMSLLDLGDNIAVTAPRIVKR